MTVPITSDLQGYTAFWREQIWLVLKMLALGWAVIVALLSLIALSLRR